MCEFCDGKMTNMSKIENTKVYIYNHRERTEEFPTGFVLYADNSMRQKKEGEVHIKYCPVCGRYLLEKNHEMRCKCAICGKAIEREGNEGQSFCEYCLSRLKDVIKKDDNGYGGEYMAGPGHF